MHAFWLSLLISQAVLFCVMVPVGLWIQRRQSQDRLGAELPEGSASVILPIKGLDPEAEVHYRHWLEQETPMPFEVIFSLQDPNDPVLPLLRKLVAEHPKMPVQILVNPIRPGLNGKSSNLSYGVEAASGCYLVMADSDIDPGPSLLTQLVAPLRDSEVGLVTSLPVVRKATNLWGGATALTFNLALTTQMAPFHLFGMAKAIGASGACFSIKREVLTDIGGFEAFGGYIAEDAEMGRRVVDSGKRVALGPTVELVQGGGSCASFFSVVMRGAHLNLYFYSPLTAASTIIALFGDLLIMAGAAVAGDKTLLEAALIVWLFRTGCCAVLQIGSDARTGYRYAWVLPVVEVAFAAAFVLGLFVRTYRWRGVLYRVGRGGRVTVESEA